ncbi:MAG: fimbrial assembly protein [Terracidiphilus sp.]
MRISLNLATRPFTDVGPAIKNLRIAMAILAVLAIGLGFGLRALHHKAEEARARDHSLDGQIAGITRERQSYQDLMRQPANAQLLKQSIALNKLFDLKSFSWTLAMEDLETVLPGGVQVSTLEPIRDEKTKVITLHLHVIGPRDRNIDLVRNLEHSRRFLFPRIVGENAVESTLRPGEPLEPVSASNRVNFDVLADYNPAAPSERKSLRKSIARSDQDQTPPSHPSISGGISGGIAPDHRPVRPPYTGPDAIPGRAKGALGHISPARVPNPPVVPPPPSAKTGVVQ